MFMETQAYQDISSSQITVTIDSIQAISNCPESYFVDINKRILQFMWEK